MRTDSADLHRYVVWGIAISLLAHVSAVLMFAKQPPRTFETPIFVDFLPALEPINRAAIKRQLVSPSEAPTSEHAPESPLESEKNVVVPKEQVKRGDELAAAAIGERSKPSPASQRTQQSPAQNKNRPAPQKAAPQEKPEQKKLTMKDLRLDPSTLREEFALAPDKPSQSNPLQPDTSAALSSYAPFSRPMGSGAKFLGEYGSNDYLPSLPDGDITLLNTKANRFAVFVRRVATQVFAQLRSEGWEVLRGADIQNASGFAVVRATLSADGDLIAVTIESSSGSVRFDRLLQSSAQKGARDPNPPEGAKAADGKIHFIFQSKSWVDVVPQRRTGMPIERRWVLLGTGLE